MIRDAVIKHASEPKIDPSTARNINSLARRSASGPYAD
jgi:hypothetical protein